MVKKIKNNVKIISFYKDKTYFKKSDIEVHLIQMLIPLALKSVEEKLQREVAEWVGKRYSREGTKKRWGENPGSVYLGNQKVHLQVTRTRDVEKKEEILLESYQQL